MRLLTIAAAVCLALLSAAAAFPEPDPSVTFVCPQWDSVRVRGVTRSSCGDTTAVTFGYLR